MKTIITFHLYYPMLKEYDKFDIIYYCGELEAREKAIIFSKELSKHFTHITSKVLEESGRFDSGRLADNQVKDKVKILNVT